jgi:hypothetical protein
VVARAARRELVFRRHEAAFARAAREGRRLVVGPFLGEVGFELLYWIPTLRRLLAEHGVDRTRVTALTRGGAGAWYGDFAAGSIEILDLVPPDGYLHELVERRRREGNTKQYFADELDTRLTNEALRRDGDAAAVHPLLMYSRLRFVLEGLSPAADALTLADYRPLAPSTITLPEACPREFVAVKLYFSDVLPDGELQRSLAEKLVARLARDIDVVVLTSGLQLDEHVDWRQRGARIHDAGAWLTPQDNLAVQTALVERSRGLVATYGGFSYLGPLLGVPTVAVQSRPADSPVHLAVLRAAFPDAAYSIAEVDEDVDDEVERIAGALL